MRAARRGGQDRLEPADHSERSVEAPAVRHRIEVRAGPDLRQLGPRAPQTADEIARRIHVDDQPRLPHPLRDEVVRLLLDAAQARPVRTSTAAEGIKQLEPFQGASRRRGRGVRRHAKTGA